MKKTGIYRFWQIVYPIGIYDVVSSVVYFCLTMMFGAETETYMLRQMVCGAFTIPFILSFYRQDRQLETVVYGEAEKPAGSRTLWNIFCAVAAGAMTGIAVNNLIAMTPLIGLSPGFDEANTSFFAGGILYELLGSCLVIPAAEELLYRGVVWKRLRMYFGNAAALVLSAVIFGVSARESRAVFVCGRSRSAPGVSDADDGKAVRPRSGAYCGEHCGGGTAGDGMA